MKFYQLLNSDQKYYLAQKLELIFSKSEAATLMGINRKVYNDNSFKPMNEEEFSKRIKNKEVLFNGF